MAETGLHTFWKELRRRKVIRVALVYAVTAWAAIEVASVVFPSLLLPEWTLRLLVLLALIGFPVAVGLAWAFEVKPEGGARSEGRTAGASPEPGAEPAGEERLDGWKRVAAYLNRDVRTVRRWEKNQGLPVRRLMHDRQATVYAYRSELDAWLERRDTGAPPVPSAKSGLPGKPGRKWLWLSLPLLVVGLLAALYWPPGKPSGIQFGEWDWVLVTRFDNRTGEDVLEGTVEYALQRELANSRYVKVAPRERINDALRLMRLPPDTPVDVATGREISLRDGGIRILIGGRIEKFGNAYLIGAELVNPSDGVTLASFSQEASGQEAILPRVGDLARDVRTALGESLASIQASEEMLAKVTTPSLAALRLFSEANRMMSGPERNQAVPVLEQAVRIDPDFASAHLLLTYALRDRDEVERAREHLQRAVELADETTERERLFILATYYRYLGNLEREIETYELLNRLYPDHYWANGNLGAIYEWLGQLEEAYPHKLRAAEWRPNMDWEQIEAAEFAYAFGDVAEGDRLVGRARGLIDERGYLHSRLLPIETAKAWWAGDYEAALRELEALVAAYEPEELVAYGALYVQVRSLYLALGKLDRFRHLSRLRPQLGQFEVQLDLESGQTETLEAYLEGDLLGFWDAVMLALDGRFERARAMIDDPRTVATLPPPYLERDWKNFANGYLALMEGRLQDAVDLLSTDTMMLNITSKREHLFAMHALAQAHERLGQPEEAIAVLEQAALQGPLTILYPGANWQWQRNHVYLHSLYRKAGEKAAAKRVADELRETLQIADQGHPFLTALER